MTFSGCRGCRQQPPAHRDLLTAASKPELRSDTLTLPALARDAKFELRGFAPFESTPQGNTAWTVGHTARLRLPFHSTCDKELRFVARAHESLGPDLPLSVRLNSTSVGELVLGTASREYRLPLPAAAQVRGDNFLELSVPRQRTPSPQDPDQRPLAVAISELDVRPFGARTAQSPPQQTTTGQIDLPPSSSAAWYLRVPEGGQLLVRTRATGSGPSSRVVVRLETDTQSRHLLDAPAESARVALSPAGAIARVEVANEGSAPVTLQGMEIVWPAERPSPAASLAKRPNVIVYLIDTLRPDYLGTYGHPTPTSPEIDAFAAESLVFEHAWAQASWTRPATASLLTGLYPTGHGADKEDHALAPDKTTLAEILSAYGYRTAGFVANHLVGKRYGFDQGYDDWTEEKESAAQLGERALQWIDAGKGPFFVYLHTMEPHSPYTPEERFAAPFAFDGYTGDRDTPALLRLGQLGQLAPDGLRYLKWQYQGEVRQNDAAFGALVSALRQRHLLDDTIVVLVADHGEELLEHGGTEHAKTLYQELVHVPLVVHLPTKPLREARIHEPVQQIDVLPTLLGILGIRSSIALPGRDLSAWWLGRALAPRTLPFLFAEERFTVTNKDAVRLGPLKLIVNNDGQRLWRAGTYLELYDLAHDPSERDNLEARLPITRTFLFQEIERFRAEQSAAATEGKRLKLSDDERDQLRALGYIE